MGKFKVKLIILLFIVLESYLQSEDIGQIMMTESLRRMSLSKIRNSNMYEIIQKEKGLAKPEVKSGAGQELTSEEMESIPKASDGYSCRVNECPHCLEEMVVTEYSNPMVPQTCEHCGEKFRDIHKN
jgi:hypothetical protein